MTIPQHTPSSVIIFWKLKVQFAFLDRLHHLLVKCYLCLNAITQSFQNPLFALVWPFWSHGRQKLINWSKLPSSLIICRCYAVLWDNLIRRPFFDEVSSGTEWIVNKKVTELIYANDMFREQQQSTMCTLQPVAGNGKMIVWDQNSSFPTLQCCSYTTASRHQPTNSTFFSEICKV